MADLTAAPPGATAKERLRPEAMTRSDPDTYRAELDQRKEELDEREGVLDDLAVGLDHRRDNLDEREEQLNDREADLEVREAELGEALRRCPELRAGLRRLAAAGEIRWPI
jgi:hypothetical protein